MSIELKRMTPSRAAYFMERFKREEKLLGPNEQAALTYVIDMLEKATAIQQAATGEPVKVVPYNPTTEMMFSMKGLDPALSLNHCRELWSVAWKAAPTNHQAPSVPDDVARDAERYRWLRNEANFAARVAPQVCMLDCLTAQASALHAEAVDAAIDAAMLAAKVGGKQ